MAIKIGVGLGTHSSALESAYEALQHAKVQLTSETADLAIIFATIDAVSPLILSKLKGYLPETPIIGCCGAAIISNEGIFKHGIIILLIKFSEGTYFNTAFIKDLKSRPLIQAGDQFAEKLLYGFKGIRRDLGLVFSDGLIGEKQDIILGMQQKLGKSFPIVGASASDNLEFKKTPIIFEDQVLSEAACGILWGGKLNFGLGVKHGWKPLGKMRSVTRSTGNIVYEIDSRPAVELYEDYLAAKIKKLKIDLNRISVLYPIGIYISGREEYLLRNILSVENDGSIILQGDIPQGSQIRLMIGTKESCLLATQQAAEEAKKGLLNKQANLALVFDSISRYMLLKRDAIGEIEIIKNHFTQNTIIAGIYTYGEQAPMKAIGYLGKVYSHNQTVTILAIEG
ncbi:MAG: hypothetical protein C4533_08095 [Candidatus Omnitrophota bacterium]|jgi:hypothetical protein|nr:MAG: hypothetical protein C4533_08095 [Candidatus Omnitrophota bacterium]